MPKYKNAKYIKDKFNNKDNIKVEVDGIPCNVPIDPDLFDKNGTQVYEGNKYYSEIMEQVDAGELTIEEAD